jgi:hypothetical protein
MRLRAVFIAAGFTATIATTALAPQVVGAVGRPGWQCAGPGGGNVLAPGVGDALTESPVWNSAQDVAGTVTVLETSTTTLTLVSTTPTTGWTEKTVQEGPPRVAVTFTNATDTVYVIARFGLYVARETHALGIRLNSYSCTPIGT